MTKKKINVKKSKVKSRMYVWKKRKEKMLRIHNKPIKVAFLFSKEL